jgi:hypothetical protein
MPALRTAGSISALCSGQILFDALGPDNRAPHHHECWNLFGQWQAEIRLNHVEQAFRAFEARCLPRDQRRELRGSLLKRWRLCVDFGPVGVMAYERQFERPLSDTHHVPARLWPAFRSTALISLMADRNSPIRSPLRRCRATDRILRGASCAGRRPLKVKAAGSANRQTNEYDLLACGPPRR